MGAADPFRPLDGNRNPESDGAPQQTDWAPILPVPSDAPKLPRATCGIFGARRSCGMRRGRRSERNSRGYELRLGGQRVRAADAGTSRLVDQTDPPLANLAAFPPRGSGW